MAKKQVIRLTEGDLRRIIKESVSKILKENVGSRSLQFKKVFPDNAFLVCYSDFNSGWGNYEIMTPDEYEEQKKQFNGLQWVKDITADNIDELWDEELYAHKEPRYEEPVDYYECTIGDLVTAHFDNSAYFNAKNPI